MTQAIASMPLIASKVPPFPTNDSPQTNLAALALRTDCAAAGEMLGSIRAPLTYELANLLQLTGSAGPDKSLTQFSVVV